MKSSKLTWKDFGAVLIALATLYGIYVMFNSEGFVVLQNAAGTPGQIVQDFNSKVLPAIKHYSMAIGLILLAVSIAYILLGSQDEIETNLSEPGTQK